MELEMDEILDTLGEFLPNVKHVMSTGWSIWIQPIYLLTTNAEETLLVISRIALTEVK